mmetsp:Transcript_37230/g.78527  ORF Transcript_37230/g.78527 Transcript_37230/m.78527 type:complete len:416 (+) Transcript_37230:225-1472(+)
MIATPAAISEDEVDAGNTLAEPIYCRGMARVVSMQFDNTTSSSTVKLYPVISQTAMPTDEIAQKKEADGSAMPPATALVVQGGGITNVMSSTMNSTRLVSVNPLNRSASHENLVNEAGSHAFHKGQGRTATYKNRKCTAAHNISGRWTAAEHEAFLQGLKVYGREWKKVATCIPTRTSAQIRSHAQKYFAKVSKEQQQMLALTEQRRSSLQIGIPSKTNESTLQENQPPTQSFTNTMNSILTNPSAIESRVCKTLASLRERYRELEGQLQQNQTLSSCSPSIQSGGVAMGPATVALELEKQSLRKAAVARYERKKRETQLRPTPLSIVSEPNVAPCAHVSLASMPSHGGFDSSDVIALSVLGGSLGREKIENKTISTIKGDPSLKLVRERLQLIEHEHNQQTQLKKLEDSYVKLK